MSNREYPDHPRVGVGAVVLREGRVLLSATKTTLKLLRQIGFMPPDAAGDEAPARPGMSEVSDRRAACFDPVMIRIFREVTS